MAISHIDSNQANTASGTSVTPVEPTGAQEDDYIFAWGSHFTSGGTWTAPGDFNVINTRDTSVGQVFNTWLGYKKRGATAGDGYQFDYSGAAAQMRVQLIAFRGVHLVTPFDVTFNLSNHVVDYADDVTSAAKAITTVTNGAWVVLFQAWIGGVAGFALAPPSGYTMIADLLSTSRTGVVAAKEISPAGLETPGVWQTTGTVVTQDSTNTTIALKPATAGENFSLMGQIVM